MRSGSERERQAFENINRTQHAERERQGALARRSRRPFDSWLPGRGQGLSQLTHAPIDDQLARLEILQRMRAGRLVFTHDRRGCFLLTKGAAVLAAKAEPEGEKQVAAPSPSLAAGTHLEGEREIAARRQRRRNHGIMPHPEGEKDTAAQSLA